MTRKRGGFGLLALGLIVTVGIATVVFRQAQLATDTARLESVDVLVAAQDIPERTLLAGPLLAVKRTLPATLPPGALSRPEEAVGQMTGVRMVAGDFILPGKLIAAESRGGLASTIPKGKVVITVPGSDILSTGAVRAGDTVDVLVTIKPLDRQSGPTAASSVTPSASVSQVVGRDLETATTQGTVRGLKVLAIGSVAALVAPDQADVATPPAAGAGAPLPGNGLIVFAVDPQDALTLKALKDSDRVKLEMVLRATEDEHSSATHPVTLGTISDQYGFTALPTPSPRPEAKP